MSQITLPPLKPGQANTFTLPVRSKLNLPPDVAAALHAAGSVAGNPENQVIVPTRRPETLHPIAATIEKTLRKAKPDIEGFIHCHAIGQLNVHIGSASIDRVVLIGHALLETAVKRGYRLMSEGGLYIVVDDQPLAIRLYETKNKVPHVPTPAELKSQAREDEFRARYSISRSARNVYPSWDFRPSGRLALEISDPRQTRWRADPIIGRWYDRESKRLEEYLTNIVATLKTGAVIARHQRAKEAEEARLEKEKEARQREQEQLRRLLDRVTAFLLEKAEEHTKLAKIEALAAYFAECSGHDNLKEHDELHRAIDFVLVNLRQDLTADSVNEEIVERHLLERESW